MDLGFRGEVVDFYHRYRRGYPPAVVDALVDRFALTTQDTVVDLGCGTGQLTLPLAARVRAAVGVDPEPDMLARARKAAGEADLANVSWLLGADTDVPALRALLGDRSVGVVTIGQALHWMNHEDLFRALAPLVRPGGGVAVLANGAPLWLLDSPWSTALRDVLEQWFGARPQRTCGTDELSRRRYADSLTVAGFDVVETELEHTGTLGLDQVIGGVYSALSVDQLPGPAQRPVFRQQVRRALEPHGPFVERVRVSVLTGRIGRAARTSADLLRPGPGEASWTRSGDNQT
ncbi:MAG TPA: class I SAM-dependent methyltransferase [Pseudonocardiaceae bacterium]|jgi:trans-aconitate methyltransferase|nr:class I SAM-dependent methyltransferase [Pseudonocardiaceae bacterium]